MSIAELDVTPSRARNPQPGSTKHGVVFIYHSEHVIDEIALRVGTPAPPHLQVSLEFGQEGDAWWARIPELDVSGDGDDLQGALAAVYGAALEWLAYLRDERPELAPELGGQERYVPLLNAPGTSWFRDVRPA